MNLILLFDSDFASPAGSRVRLTGRRLRHVLEVHRAKVGDELVVGRAGGDIGRGRVERLDPDLLEMEVVVDRAPPPPLPLTLVLALPRPKVLDRVVVATTSLGIKRIILVNAWRVEKSFWSSPRLDPDNLADQAVLGLEQARDTVRPLIETRRFLRPFAEEELPALSEGTTRLVGHPNASSECPRGVAGAATLVIGPEGGFIADEIRMFERLGFTPVSLGERILRVETAVPFLVSRLF